MSIVLSRVWERLSLAEFIRGPVQLIVEVWGGRGSLIRLSYRPGTLGAVGNGNCELHLLNLFLFLFKPFSNLSLLLA